MDQKDIDRILVYFRSSNNAHGWVNHSVFTGRMNKFTRNPSAKEELVLALRNMADHIERDYPGYPENCGIRV